MDVENWFENGCSYHEGVMLYSSLKGHKPNLLKLFLRKQSKVNEEKLKYELGKFKNKSRPSKPTVVKKALKTVVKDKPATTASQTTNEIKHSHSFYRLNQIDIRLHPVLIKQKNDFQLAISAHEKLVKLHASEEGEALKLCLEIENLFDSIETAQKVLDHYVQHKVVLQTKSRGYEDYNSAQLVRARTNKGTSISKYRKTVKHAAAALKKAKSKEEIKKAEIHLQREERKLLRHEMDLRELDDRINNYE